MEYLTSIINLSYLKSRDGANDLLSANSQHKSTDCLLSYTMTNPSQLPAFFLLENNQAFLRIQGRFDYARIMSYLYYIYFDIFF